MGVSGLWSILAPTKKYKPLRTLHGQTLAIDLSIWICENQGVRNMQNKVLRPHLRYSANILFSLEKEFFYINETAKYLIIWIKLLPSLTLIYVNTLLCFKFLTHTLLLFILLISSQRFWKHNILSWYICVRNLNNFR